MLNKINCSLLVCNFNLCFFLSNSQALLLILELKNNFRPSHQAMRHTVVADLWFVVLVDVKNLEIEFVHSWVSSRRRLFFQSRRWEWRKLKFPQNVRKGNRNWTFNGLKSMRKDNSILKNQRDCEDQGEKYFLILRAAYCWYFWFFHVNHFDSCSDKTKDNVLKALLACGRIWMELK